MHKSQKSPSRALLQGEGDSLLFFRASKVKLIHGLLAPLRPTTTYVHGSDSLDRFHSPLCSKEHVELIPSDFVNYASARSNVDLMAWFEDKKRKTLQQLRARTARFN